MSDLTVKEWDVITTEELMAKEQKAVRNALKFLRRAGATGKALRCKADSIRSSPPAREGHPALALRAACLAGVPIDDLLAGRWLSSRISAWAATGPPPDDFADEEQGSSRYGPTVQFGDHRTAFNVGRW